ncbi:hypothetical protein PGTUg99_006991 [Puccinia graminis f. sp. tritici]|uniref:Uncharacterized protein n=1 Tax=Puccinia graminis f. sp. tritici TaxID=56615 RepID=A0A5B0RZ81_PUCGR|nr:hypothetical protein PGTUg99_006991 [Puccinia graminis f. sp. tritici]
MKLYPFKAVKKGDKPVLQVKFKGGQNRPLKYAALTFPTWTSTDRMFIEVFHAIAINHLKKIGLYDTEAMAKTWPSLTFDRFGAIALLRDLGILPAWQSVGLKTQISPRGFPINSTVRNLQPKPLFPLFHLLHPCPT